MVVRLWTAVLVVGLGIPVACSAMGSAPPPEPELNSLQKIAGAVARGEIDPDTAVLYRVFAVVDAERLPAPYRSGQPLRDGTSILRHARSRFDELRPEVRDQLRPLLFPRGRP